MPKMSLNLSSLLSTTHSSMVLRHITGMARAALTRMIMLITEENIREVIAFPMNSNAQDLLLGSPRGGEVTEQRLREIHIKLR